MDFGRILDRIYEAFCAFFGRILGEAFQVEELALMIRATSGRSIDQSIYGLSIDRLISRSIHGSIVHHSIDRYQSSV